MALVNAAGTVTYGLVPELISLNVFDNVRDYPGVYQTAASNKTRSVWEPQDPSDLEFSSQGDTSTTKDPRTLTWFVEGGLNAGVYRW